MIRKNEIREYLIVLMLLSLVFAANTTSMQLYYAIYRKIYKNLLLVKNLENPKIGILYYVYKRLYIVVLRFVIKEK